MDLALLVKAQVENIPWVNKGDGNKSPVWSKESDPSGDLKIIVDDDPHTENEASEALQETLNILVSHKGSVTQSSSFNDIVREEWEFPGEDCLHMDELTSRNFRRIFFRLSPSYGTPQLSFSFNSTST